MADPTAVTRPELHVSLPAVKGLNQQGLGGQGMAALTSLSGFSLSLPGALLKAAFICTQIVTLASQKPLRTQLLECSGGGFEVHSWSSLPHGSGLGMFVAPFAQGMVWAVSVGKRRPGELWGLASAPVGGFRKDILSHKQPGPPWSRSQAWLVTPNRVRNTEQQHGWGWGWGSPSLACWDALPGWALRHSEETRSPTALQGLH